MHKILVVDDSTSMRQMVTMTLRNSGYDVTDAEDGQIGVDKAKADNFDAIVTDINMPNKDGLQLIAELRMQPNYKFKPIICLTTESSGDMKAKGKAAGATGWMVKPFSPDKLLATIKKVL